MSFVGYILTYRESGSPERRRNLAPVFAFGDADVITPHTWAETVAHLRGQFALAKPYRSPVDLSAEETTHIAAGHFGWLPDRARHGRPTATRRANIWSMAAACS